MVWFCIDPFFPPSICLITPLTMQATDSLPADPLQMLRSTIARIEGAYAPATIRAYFADFAAFIAFCDLNNQSALPANAAMTADFIRHISVSRRSSASIRRAVVAISAIHLFNRFTDPTKDPEVRIAMKRMHRTLGRSANQAYGIRQEMLHVLLANVGDSIRGLRDAALLQLAYDTLCRRSELVSLRIDDVVAAPHADGMHYSILLRKSKVDQEARGRYLPLRAQTMLAIEQWTHAAKLSEGPILRSIDRGENIGSSLGSGQINRIYKQLARQASLNSDLITRISGHSFRVGAAQDLLASGASMPTIMQRGGWSKSDTVMRYLEQFRAIESN
jgi:site-specific recombinase XerD